MEEIVHSSELFRFGTFEVDLRAGELRKNGVRLKLTGQPFQVLAILLERAGEVVTREELQKNLWPDTFVEVEHNLNSAINKIREALGDSAESPRFVETLPRRGYRFIAAVSGTADLGRRVNTGGVVSERVDSGSVHQRPVGKGAGEPSQEPSRFSKTLKYSVAGLLILLAVIALWMAERPRLAVPRSLTRVTFDDGLQIGVSWSPDGGFIAYSSDRGGKFDIWVQQVSGGDPVQVTKSPGHNWQPDWSPDGKYIAYRSEDGEGGLFIIPALGGGGLARKIVSAGFYPRWSPDGSRILFQTSQMRVENEFNVVSLDGKPPRKVSTGFGPLDITMRSAAWHPDGKRISIWVLGPSPVPTFLTVPVSGGEGVESKIDPQVLRQFGEVSASPRDLVANDGQFSWMPSGKAIIFECTFRGVRNLWKMSVDRE